MHYGELMAANPKWTPQQAIFIYHLKNNPGNVQQIYGELDNNAGGMCALGLGMEAFGIIRTWEQYKEKFPDSHITDFAGAGATATYDPYKIIAEILDVSRSNVSDIYNLNDNDELSFKDIADVFGDWLNSDRRMGIREFHEWKQDEPVRKFEADWNAMQATVKGLLETIVSKHKLTNRSGLTAKIPLDEVYADANEIWDGYGN